MFSADFRRRMTNKKSSKINLRAEFYQCSVFTNKDNNKDNNYKCLVDLQEELRLGRR